MEFLLEPNIAYLILLGGILLGLMALVFFVSSLAVSYAVEERQNSQPDHEPSSADEPSSYECDSTTHTTIKSSTEINAKYESNTSARPKIEPNSSF